MIATYRLQLGPELDFAAVQDLVPYLRELGISHLYLSPCLEARSPHGYDVTDPTRVNSALGGEEGLRALAAAGLKIVLDIVPNHMGAFEENRFWADPELREKFFDVDPDTGRWRRFFDIDDMAAVRQEDPEVFAATHAKSLELVRDGVVDGLRVDHPDGLADPLGYLERLRSEGVDRVWVEKILQPGEALRDWPVRGTVGYEFLVDVAALYVDPAAEAAFTDLYAELTGETRTFAEVALEAQVQQATTTFAPEVARLRSLVDAEGIADALAALPVYRTYIRPPEPPAPEDRAAIDAAQPTDGVRRALADAAFVTRFQQTAPAVMAKGVEDTAFYRYTRLLALNDVGGDPGRFGLPVEEFHAANAERQRRFPRSLLITQTHDTKRSGDVRARIGALSRMPGEWRAAVLRWRELNAGLRSGGAPDANEEYLIYQTLVGAMPIGADRLCAYLEKALREAKVNTSWVEQDHDYEERVKAFAAALLEHQPFLDAFEPFLARVVVEGRRAALGQLLLKLAVPGVPDVYQGDELEALSLVDPDNRRPVEWAARRDALRALRSGAEPAGFGERKLLLIHRALELRARRPDAFGPEGAYEPLDAGPGVCAFARGREVVVVAPLRDWEAAEVRLPAGLRGRWRDVLGGGELDLGERLPVTGMALLERA